MCDPTVLRALDAIQANLDQLRAVIIPMGPSENLTTVQDAARRLHMSQKTVLRWCRRYGCGVKVGHLWRVSIAALVTHKRLPR